jgi:hypothetical protein
MADVDRVLESIRSLGDLDRAIAAVRASGATGEIRLASTPIGFIWAPTREEWLAAAYRNQARHRPPDADPIRVDPVAPWSEEEHLRPPFPDLPEDKR